MIRLKDILWTVPFISFLAGYYLIYLLYTIPELATPCVVGKQLPEAVLLLSNHNLNARLLAEKEDPDLPDYTIVSQTPREGAKIKAHQSVFMVLTRQPEKHKAPHVVGKKQETLDHTLTQDHLRYKCYPIASNHPTNICFAQYPRPNESLDENALICYISKGNKKPVIMPDFRGKTLEIVQEFLATHEIVPEVVGASSKNPNTHIIEQRPLPGSIVRYDHEQKPNIQLHIQ